MVTGYLEQNNHKPKKTEEEKKALTNGYIIFSQFILEEIFLVGGSIFLGIYLDRRLGTKCLFTIVLALIFVFVPIYNLVKRTR